MYKRVGTGVSRVEVYERVGEFVISVRSLLFRYFVLFYFISY